MSHRTSRAAAVLVLAATFSNPAGAFVTAPVGGTRERSTQNPAVAVTSLFALEARRWLLPWKAGVLFGPYFEGDLGERLRRAR
jgi:hypothetical protein